MRHKIALAILVSAITFVCSTSGCASTDESSIALDLPALYTSSFPDMAIEVLLHSSRSPDEYLGFIRQRLEALGFTIATYNPNVLEIRTRSKSVGGRSLILKVTTEDNATYLTTVARISGLLPSEGSINPAFEDESSLDAMAYWNNRDDRHARAFARVVYIAQYIEHDVLDYAVFRPTR